jgi:maltose alpha-D-glucosyltransferase / alpha-amylase
MQWCDDPNAGFSTADELVHPVIDEGPYSYRQVNVESQRRNPDSMLNHTGELIRLRKECPEIGWGEFQILDAGCPEVLAMRYDWRGNSLVILHNFADEPREAHFKVKDGQGKRLVDLRIEDESRAGADGLHHISLHAYDYRWYRVGDLSHLLRRTKE